MIVASPLRRRTRRRDVFCCRRGRCCRPLRVVSRFRRSDKVRKETLPFLRSPLICAAVSSSPPSRFHRPIVAVVRRPRRAAPRFSLRMFSPIPPLSSRCRRTTSWMLARGVPAIVGTFSSCAPFGDLEGVSRYRRRRRPSRRRTAVTSMCRRHRCPSRRRTAVTSMCRRRHSPTALPRVRVRVRVS